MVQRSRDRWRLSGDDYACSMALLSGLSKPAYWSCTAICQYVDTILIPGLSQLYCAQRLVPFNVRLDSLAKSLDIYKRWILEPKSLRIKNEFVM